MHSSTKTKLLLLLENEDQSAAIRAVLLSGLLPEPLLQKFLDNLTERAVRRVLALPGCPEWTGRASWDAWAVKRLHSKDRSSIALVETTERIIDATTREARDKWDRRTGMLNPVIRGAEEAARLSLLPCNLALEGARMARDVALGADVASYKAVRWAPTVEREQQYQDLMSVINSLPEEV